MKKHLLVGTLILLVAALFPVGAQITQPLIWSTVTSTSTGTLDDFAPGLSGNTIIRMNNATLATIDGFSGGFNGQRIILESIGAGQVDLAPQNTGSAAANRLINIAGMGSPAASSSLAAGVGTAEYAYDGTTARWRLIHFEQGDWITSTYGSGHFTSSGGTWGVDSGDRVLFQYYLRGRELMISWNLGTTSVGAGTTTNLLVSNSEWGGFTTVATSQYGSHDYSDNSGTHAIGRAFMASSVLTIQKVDLSNWTSVATNTTSTFGSIAVQVQ